MGGLERERGVGGEDLREKRAHWAFLMDWIRGDFVAEGGV